MKIRPAVLYALIFALVGSVAVFATALADEHRNEGDLFIATYENTSENQYYSQTTDTDSSSFFLKVHLRAWGESPNPLKAQSSDYVYDSNHILTPQGIWTGYQGVYPAQHVQQSSPSPVFDYYYTSATGATSSACWFENGTDGGCSGTLIETKP
jgi:hypothetical protein